ncbi:hypothetical protein SACIG1242_1066 [Staphylococcus aureus subsp. aureus CIG1242]|nr:hypothetical protein SACIG1242_1066 [Staphylococcus aureus subsp. aureus CIG1242]
MNIVFFFTKKPIPTGFESMQMSLILIKLSKEQFLSIFNSYKLFH